MSPVKLSIEELIALAKQASPLENEKLKSEAREFQDVETFIQDKNLRHGQKKIHNLIVYSLYRDWAKENPMSLSKFNKAFSKYFPKKKGPQNNLCYKLTYKHKDGKFDTSTQHLDRCREMYGRRNGKKEDKAIPEQVSGIERPPQQG